MTASAQQTTEEAKEDEANLDFARKQTDLVLERIDQQLAKKQVDAELLKSLGWSEAELQKFVSRWKDLRPAPRTTATKENRPNRNSTAPCAALACGNKDQRASAQAARRTSCR